ncbi:uncharacterized protein BDV14DRAFT_73431 [Aspergillus stella-maris]|uniref:uncharacterized protein n=1 Tax=Aspergillus stella-maris TaxID=1810926 RepID=UPI003CCD5F27
MTMNRGGNVGPAHLLNETDRRIYGAMKASSRLQYLMCDHEDPADMSSRVKRELQNVFAMPRERQY